jgi:hypothetical protein
MLISTCSLDIEIGAIASPNVDEGSTYVKKKKAFRAKILPLSVKDLSEQLSMALTCSYSAPKHCSPN